MGYSVSFKNKFFSFLVLSKIGLGIFETKKK